MRHPKLIRSVLFASILLAAAFSSVVGAQQSQPARPAQVPLRVEIVLSRWQADKKVASLPFTVWPVASTGGARYVALRVGVDVPVGTSTVTRGTGAANQTTTTSTTSVAMEYRNIGTSIDCSAAVVDGGFSIDLRVADSAIFTDQNAAAGTVRFNDRAPFRTFSLTHAMTVRDGQTVQFASATDKLTGETLKVDVTVNVVK